MVQLLLKMRAKVNTSGKIRTQGGARLTGNTKFNFCCTPLTAAAAGGHGKIVRLLLEAEAEVNAPGDIAISGRIRVAGNARVSVYTGALSAAVGGGYTEIVQMLLDAGAKATGNPADRIEINRGITAIGAAEINVDYTTLDIHGSVEIGGNAVLNAYHGALSAAVGGGHSEIVQLLLNNGAEANGYPPGGIEIHGTISGSGNAILNIDYASVQIHGSFVVDNNFTINTYRGVLSVAAARGLSDIIQLLLDAGAEVDGHPPGSIETHGAFVGSGNATFNLDCASISRSGASTVNENATCNTYRGACAIAAARGHDDIVQSFIKARAARKSIATAPISSIAGATQAAITNGPDEITQPLHANEMDEGQEEDDNVGPSGGTGDEVDGTEEEGGGKGNEGEGEEAEGVVVAKEGERAERDAAAT
ncbi:ankyrin repeat-containing domain protein [Tricharina praecox]|uniref:ankyrin repeat-containing domain protein n=1 Tax=Tricharina praecox TaxID=43433 RepID=UPI0022207747|nr:ankyrin repeat-containing domain protein [Tricharina praecox]KAI5850855.1 ankyrin repeat-containing domain protein [Tricharina praecox]